MHAGDAHLGEGGGDASHEGSELGEVEDAVAVEIRLGKEAPRVARVVR